MLGIFEFLELFKWLHTILLEACITYMYRNIPNRSPGGLNKNLEGGYTRFRQPGVALTNVKYNKNPQSQGTLLWAGGLPVTGILRYTYGYFFMAKYKKIARFHHYILIVRSSHAIALKYKLCDKVMVIFYPLGQTKLIMCFRLRRGSAKSGLVGRSEKYFILFKNFILTNILKNVET